MNACYTSLYYFLSEWVWGCVGGFFLEEEVITVMVSMIIYTIPTHRVIPSDASQPTRIIYIATPSS